MKSIFARFSFILTFTLCTLIIGATAHDFSGKPEDIYLFTGGPPQAAFGNSAGDREMLEYAQASGKSALMMLVLHDDPVREYAYGPAEGLPATKIGTFPQPLFDEAKNRGWKVISMKKDWKHIFAFEKVGLIVTFARARGLQIHLHVGR